MLILNHYAASLSQLDKTICKSVPPGGNWKDIPEDVPSQRIANIRKSYEAGEGSRSTYYGRLHPSRPSYTINTYFTRPGNGCHIHYDYEGGQHRTISHREAARLQSFPDNFEFVGSKTSIATQIGNAVPPLLAYQIARKLPFAGQFVDLFCGAGGLGLGFTWAGWQPLIANDIEGKFLETYRKNVHDKAILGDIRNEDVFNKIVETVKAERDFNTPLFILGGPPCQGFSTAGNKRSMDDERNWLFKQYKKMLEELKPDGFVFENVTGLLNMEGGKVFELVKQELSSAVDKVIGWKLSSENYGIPQRRARVILIGSNYDDLCEEPPEVITKLEGNASLFGTLPITPSVTDALSDLPPLEPSEDGSAKGYKSNPRTLYQEFVRGKITAENYIQKVRKQG